MLLNPYIPTHSKKHMQIIPLPWRLCLLNRGCQFCLLELTCGWKAQKDQGMQMRSSYILWIFSHSFTDTWNSMWNINSLLFQELLRKLAAKHRGQARTVQEMMPRTATAGRARACEEGDLQLCSSVFSAVCSTCCAEVDCGPTLCTVCVCGGVNLPS